MCTQLRLLAPIRHRAVLALILALGLLSGFSLSTSNLPSVRAAGISLQRITLSPTVLHFPQQDKITYMLNVGNSTQVASVYILLIDPLGREYHQLGTPLRSDDGLWHRYLQLPADAPSGIWHVTQLVIQDSSSEASIYSNQDAHSPLIAASFTVMNPHGAFVPRMTTISVNGHSPMVDDPITYTVNVHSSTRLDLGSVGFSFVRLSGPQHNTIDVPFTSVSLMTNGDGAYRAIARVPQAGHWTVTKLCLQDVTGLSRCYSAADVMAATAVNRTPIRLADLSISVRPLSNGKTLGSLVVTPSSTGPNVGHGEFAVFGVVVKQPLVNAGQAEQFYIGGAAGSMVHLNIRDARGHPIVGTSRTVHLDGTGQASVTLTIPAHIADMVSGSITGSRLTLTAVVTTTVNGQHMITRSRTFQVRLL